MRNDYSDKLNTTGLQNHYVPGSPTLNHNSHFSKDSKKVCSESKESNAIFLGTKIWGQQQSWSTTECFYKLNVLKWQWNTLTRLSSLMALFTFVYIIPLLYSSLSLRGSTVDSICLKIKCTLEARASAFSLHVLSISRFSWMALASSMTIWETREKRQLMTRWRKWGPN